MPRAKRGFKARRRRNKILKLAKGYYGARGRIFTDAQEQVRSGWIDAFRNRREKKRDLANCPIDCSAAQSFAISPDNTKNSGI